MKTLTSIVLAALAFFAMGCGPAEQFVGLWTGNGTVTYTLTMPDGLHTVTQQLVNDSVTVVDGAASDVVFNWNNCNLPGAVDRDLATFQAGFTCTLPGTDTIVYTFNAGNAAITQSSINMTASGPVTITEGGVSYPGTFTVSEQLTKIGKN